MVTSQSKVKPPLLILPHIYMAGIRKDPGWFVELGDDIRHREGLTGAGDTKQSLELVAFLEALD